ncbi:MULTISPECIES: hypothetical protein [unclassified Mesorhizobium]|uniref:hypothetical protein n=1 Tax=unclassified Mesorhizobium TaxID=325217 RepID=UPI00333DA49E
MSNVPDIDLVLLGHPSDFAHFRTIVEHNDGARAAERVARNEATFRAFINWMPAYATQSVAGIELNGTCVRAALVICPFLPQDISTPRTLKAAYGKVIEGCRIASDMGAKVVALGGFTSILAGSRRIEVAAEAGITLTSGNALTAALAVEQLRTALQTDGRALENETVAVLGASGDIGRTVVGLLDGIPREILLVAQNHDRLSEVRNAFGHLRMRIATAKEAVAEADAMIVATSACHPVISASDLRPKMIVCDVGYPNSIFGTTKLDGAYVFRGGLAQLPHPVDMAVYTQLDQGDKLFGCFTEGIVLAARPDLHSLASLQGAADINRAHKLLAAAAQLGIVPFRPSRAVH